MKEKDIIKNKVLELLIKGVRDFLGEKNNLSLFDQLKIKIEYSRNEKFGDYSSSFLLENKEYLGNPQNISGELIARLKNDYFTDITFSQPGFINFKISRKKLIEYANSMIADKNNLIPEVQDKRNIIFEYVSANPTGPLNIVSARAAATGACITNLLKITGHDVHREFYVNDYGNQVLLLGVSCIVRLRESQGIPLKVQEDGEEREIQDLIKENVIPSEGYRGEYVKEIALEIYNENKLMIDSKMGNELFKELAEFFALEATKKILESQKKDLKNFGVEFDNFYSERTLHSSGKVFEALSSLDEKKKIRKEEGKSIFNSTEYGDDKDRVVLREDGRPTYLLADIAYHRDKINRNFSDIINIWGPDHHGYIARLKGAVEALGFPPNSFRILIAQQVNLLSKGEKVKMSKRAGTFQTMSDLMEFLGPNSRDIGRYFFVTRALETPLDFDLDLAKEESEKNPVFYLQYAYARIQSIFREVGKDYGAEEFEKLESTEERDRLLFWIARFPEEILDASKNMEPHRLTNYLQNLAKSFSKFYIAKGNKLKDCNPEERKGLSFLLVGTSICLFTGLELLGVSAPEKMEKDK